MHCIKLYVSFIHLTKQTRGVRLGYCELLFGHLLPCLQSAMPTFSWLLFHCSSYILAYNSHHLKDTFNVHSLDLKAVARSFGFSTPPRVNINIESKAAHTRKAQKATGGADYRRMKSGATGTRIGVLHGRRSAWQ